MYMYDFSFFNLLVRGRGEVSPALHGLFPPSCAHFSLCFYFLLLLMLLMLLVFVVVRY